jgi:uncharacterized protein (DUF885 family)
VTQEDPVTESSLSQVALSRPPRAAKPGALDDRFYDLVEARFRRLIRDNPIFGTYVGIHTEDERLGEASRDALLAELAEDRKHLAAVEALDANALSPEAAFERELEIHNVRRAVFDMDVHRVWERRSTAMDTIGDALFLVFARDFAPLPERLNLAAGRLEAIPAYLAESRSRATVPQVRIWQQLEIESARDLPGLFDEITAAGRKAAIPSADQARMERAATAARAAVADYGSWLETSLATGVDDWAMGREHYDELVGLRAFDGLDADAILEIGWSQLAENKAARVAAAREIDPDVEESVVIDRLKSDHPATFAEALAAYRDAMIRARTHIIEHDIVSVPADERIEVIETPDYLRNVIPFAAYFDAPKFDRHPTGIYVVTASVDDSPGAMREHNLSSISNTSVHEAYPGHHLQLSVAGKHPSLTRLTTEAPEFVEGWGMYSEQMMREQGFDDAANFRVTMHTDAIWRACRIILDIRMHRGEISVDEAVRWMVEQTSFEEPNARAEVHRYTYTPTYQLSYLLGKVLILQLRADEQRRLGSDFVIRDFHDALMRNGSLPISFQRRLLAGAAARGSRGVSGGPGSVDLAARG